MDELGEASESYSEAQHKAIWITSCITSREGLEITNLYGEFSCKWKDIVFVTAGELRKKGEEATFVLLFVLHDVQDVYYIDGKKINPRLFVLRDTPGQKPQDSDLAFLWDAVRKAEYNKSFKWLCERLGTFLIHSYKDKPFLKLIEEGSFEIPVYSSLGEAAEYCFTTFNALTDQDKTLAEVAEFNDEELRAVTAPTTERAEWREGEVIENRYVVQGIHRGGMGLVYEIFDPDTIKYYALKTFQEQFLWDEKVIRLFVNEAEIWVKLGKHPNIVTAELVKTIEGKPYIFLEFINGIDLQDLIAQGEIPLRTTLEYAIQFCHGMEYAFNTIGLIHRDIKPSNCLITRDGIVKITDFGLGKVFEELSSKDDSSAGISVPAGTAGTNRPPSNAMATSVAGTLPFMAPELFSNPRCASQLTDIYAFGLMLHMMLTGENPMYHSTVAHVIEKHATYVPENIHTLNDFLPVDLGELVLTCIEKDPALRYGNFDEIKKELHRIYEELYKITYELPQPNEGFTEGEWLNRGMSLASLSRHGEALLAFDKAIEINRSSAQAFSQKGASLISLDRCDEALVCLEEALMLDPVSRQAWFHKAEALRKKGEFRDALLSLELALELSPVDAVMLGQKGRLLLEMGLHDEAMKCFDGALGENPRIDSVWYDRGKLQMAMMLYEEAQESFLKAIEVNPRLADAWKSRGDALIKLGHYADAVKAYQKALAIDNKLTEAQVGIGNAYREMGNSQRALLSYNSVLSKMPALMAGYREKISLYVKSGQWDRALEVIQDAEKTGPLNRELILLKGQVLLECGCYDEVLLLLKDGPSDQEAAFQKEVAQFWLGEKEREVNAIVSPDALPPERVFSDVETALSVFCNPADAALQLAGFVKDRRELKLWNILAALYMLAGKWEESRKAVAMALSIDSESPEAQYLERRIKNYSSFTSFEPDEFSEKHEDPSRGGGGSLFKNIASRGYQSIAGVVKQQMVYMVLGMDTKGAQEDEITGDSGLFGAIPESGEGGGKRQHKKQEHTYLDWLTMAFIEMQQGNHLKAVNLLEKMARINPRLHAQRYYLARCFESLQHNDNARQFYERFIDSFPVSSGYYKDKALKALPKKTTPAEIEEFYRKWVAFYPQNITAWFAYIRYLAETGYCDRVRLLVLHCITHFSEEDFQLQEPQRGMNMRGVLYLYLGQLSKARACFQKSLDVRSTDPMAMIGEARALEGMKLSTKAKEIYEKLRNDSRGCLMALYFNANLLLSEENFIGALRPVEEALIRRKVSLLLSFKRAEILVHRKKYVEFFLVFTEMRQLDEQFFPLRQLRSNALADTGKLDDALEDLEDAHRFRPENPVVYKWLALFYIKKKYADKALALMEDALALHPFDRAAHMLRGIAQLSLGLPGKAVKSLRTSLIMEPQNPELLLYLAAAYYYNADVAAAEESYMKIELVTTRYLPLWLHRGVFYFKQKRYATALEFFKGALRIDAENLAVWIFRGLCELAMDIFDAAARTVEKMLLLAPQYRDAWLLKAMVEETLNDFPRAVESYMKAFSIQDGSEKEWYNLGLLHLLMEDSKGALTAFDKALAKNRDFFDAALGRAIAYDYDYEREEEDERFSPEAQRYLKLARSIDPERYEEWDETSAESENPLEALKMIEVLTIDFEFPMSSLSKIFEPLQVLHIPELDRAFF